jgi:hypothetical protein
VARFLDSVASEDGGVEERETETTFPLRRRVIKKDAGDEVAVVCNSVMGVLNTSTKTIISDEPDVEECFSVSGFADHCGKGLQKNGWFCVYVLAVSSLSYCMPKFQLEMSLLFCSVKDGRRFPSATGWSSGLRCRPLHPESQNIRTLLFLGF